MRAMSIPLRRLARLTALAVAGFAAVGLVACGNGDSTTAQAATAPEELSAQLIANDVAMREAIDAWRSNGDPPSEPPPEEVAAPARFLEDVARTLASRPNLAVGTLALLPPALASQVRELTRAARSLRKLAGGAKPRKLKTAPPKPLDDLVGFYGEARQRFGIGENYLAAIHLVETKFGKVKSNSVAGARGPMQFIPSTWRIYGMGGNIKDDHDAILAAANLLRDSGAPRSYGRALYSYNPSRLYVRAVQRYAKLIVRDPYALYFLYCWEP
jgi:Transglycosylase SLT domain